MENTQPTYGPLVAECTRRGIGRTTAYDLVKRGLLDTFSIGSRRYVYIASLNDLPRRLAELPGDDVQSRCPTRKRRAA